MTLPFFRTMISLNNHMNVVALQCSRMLQTTGNIDLDSENKLKCRRGPNALVLEGPNISPSLSKQRNPKLALEIHMINTHSEAGGY